MRQRLYRLRDADGVMHNIDLHWAISNSSRTARLTVRSLLARSVALPALSVHARQFACGIRAYNAVAQDCATKRTANCPMAA